MAGEGVRPAIGRQAVGRQHGRGLAGQGKVACVGREAAGR